MKPVLLVLIPMWPAAVEQLAERFEVLLATTPAQAETAIRAHASRIRIVLTNGTTGLSAEQINGLPQLTFAGALGVGYENIAIDHARARGVTLANGAGTNDDSVADHAMALLLATVRAIPTFDQACRQGVWRDALPMRPQLAGKTLGLLGLGTIGRKIAKRGAAFDMAVGYHSRSHRVDVAYRHFDSVDALAQWCDVLVVAVPGGPGTVHLVDAEVLEALGPGGVLVNIARGSVVDTAALAHALREGRLGGAGLDVYESEPAPPIELFDLPNVVLTPHVAGSSPEAKQATLENFLDNVTLHFDGRPVRTPI
jgi:lactate dehydrogenase-like 2-hydroxyacid dehydrogenase